MRRLKLPGTKAREGREGWSWPALRPLWLPLLAVLLLSVLHLLLFPPIRSVESIQLEVGQITEQEVRAPFRFEAPRPAAELEEARQEARSRVEPVFREVPAARARGEEKLGEFFDRLGQLRRGSPGGPAAQVARLRELYPGVERRHLDALLEAQDTAALRRASLEAAGTLLDRGIVDLLPRGNYRQVVVLAEGDDAPTAEAGRRLALDELVMAWRLEDALREELASRVRASGPAQAATAVAVYLLLPNLQYDDTATAQRRELAANAVPVVRDYARNERILDAGVRVSRDHRAVLEALEYERVARTIAEDRTIALRLRAGRLLLVVLLLGGLCWQLARTDRRLRTEPRRQLLLALLLGVSLALSAFVVSRDGWGGSAAVPVVLPAMLGTILFGGRVAWRLVGTLVLLLLLAPGMAGPHVVAWVAAAAVASTSVERLRNRDAFYRGLALVMLAYALTLGALALGQAHSLEGWGLAVLPGLASGVASVVLCLFLLPLLEALFGVTTDLTLLELSDLNHPLLKKMSLESPGTFHHSQVVGTLAETGARAIGANSLLARVGSNFHDIGKMLKPRYYAENQRDGNAHDELSPSMSALVIAAHVKDGLEMGRQWGLPRSILAFIPEHHGTSVMQFFYKKALEREDAGSIKVDDFRYPGPKPQTRETAICMLADGVEASTRSLRRPTPSRIREMVRKIIDGKMSEGQLDECGLTLSDLAKVREAFVPVLVGIHHQRVAYPGQREHEDRKEKESREARARQRRGGAAVAPNP